jgi:hypothetical protein
MIMPPLLFVPRELTCSLPPNAFPYPSVTQAPHLAASLTQNNHEVSFPWLLLTAVLFLSLYFDLVA